MNFFRKWIPAIIFGLLVFCILYPLDYLRVENSEAYKIFTQSKESYDEYVKSHGEKPKDLSFLPLVIQNQVNQDGYPLLYDSEELILTCKIRAPLGTIPSIKNYLCPPTPPVALIVCKLSSR